MEHAWSQKQSRSVFSSIDTGDMDAVCSLTLQSDKHAIVSDQNISITIYHKGNGSVKSIIMKRYANMWDTGARAPSED